VRDHPKALNSIDGTTRTFPAGCWSTQRQRLPTSDIFSDLHDLRTMRAASLSLRDSTGTAGNRLS
jgi:hypothetical protein